MRVSSVIQMEKLITDYVKTLRRDERSGVQKLLLNDFLTKWYEDCD